MINLLDISTKLIKNSQMAEHVSVPDVEHEAKKLKRDLEGWREIILPFNSILLWEKQSYPILIFVSTSILFLLFWHLDPSVLTTISVIGLIITLIDYLVPAISNQLCHPDNWTAAKERKLELICKELASNKIFLTTTSKTFYNMRYERPKLENEIYERIPIDNNVALYHYLTHRRELISNMCPILAPREAALFNRGETKKTIMTNSDLHGSCTISQSVLLQ